MEGNQNIAKMLFVFFAIIYPACVRLLSYRSLRPHAFEWVSWVISRKKGGFCYLWQNLHKCGPSLSIKTIPPPTFCNLDSSQTWITNMVCEAGLTFLFNITTLLWNETGALWDARNVICNKTHMANYESHSVNWVLFDFDMNWTFEIKKQSNPALPKGCSFTEPS